MAARSRAISAPTPCLRHAHAWLASCQDCTAWHLSRQLSRRATTVAVPQRPVARPQTLQAA